MDKRYQVFVSSTFTDLEDERKHVIQTLMEMDCIPAGMELFPAIDEEQWEFIKRIIDDCDYYLLIIGGRYGSVADDGLSYTEKEFDYAVSKGLKVIVLVHENPGQLPVDKSELNPDSREKLASFIAKASDGRLRKTWASVKDLPGLVALSMTKTIKTYPATGWVRANRISNEASLQELNTLHKENDVLRARVAELELLESKSSEVLELADFDDLYDFTCQSYFPKTGYTAAAYRAWDVSMSWGEIFYAVSPFLISNTNESTVSSTLALAAQKKARAGGRSPEVITQFLKTISVQLQAYGLINVRSLKTVKGGMALFWSLTDLGNKKMVSLRTIKKDVVKDIE
ncbi:MULTISPECIES: DUF4062 domain-containing protein [Serratia]|uniref:DUF4062 domain-containing protein n=1 Tax=Serratia TaxID=613 RepID=UPI00114E202C|nr:MULTISPECIES: DUF4062 domain-containing protein [Serratia]MBH3140946.1 DUF4062 domain-containing protein [Serratia ureilytica]MBN5263867.1 DUF4062 domain-containing protein [Serratia marcescens]QDI38308.1 DUF4062 domain-containing protein [Serratia marcescens]BEL85356.1 hypothetical protein SM12VA4_20170 [Serratia marcescens]